MTLVGDPLAIFQRIASMIAELLNVPVVCLSEIRGDELYFLSVYNNGEVSINAGHCPLNITPCATVEHSKDIRVYHNVMEHFPEASFLKEHNAYSYCGVPGMDSSGNVVSITCLVTDKPHDFTDEDKSLLQIFAQRIGAEIERDKLLREHRLAKEKILNYRKRLETIINSSSDLILLKDNNLRYLISNEVHKKLFNKNTEDIIGKTDFDFMPVEAAELCKRSDEDALRSDTPIYSEEYMMGRWWHVIKRRLVDKLGNIEGIVAVSRDITGRKKAEEALRRSESNLAEAQRIAHLGSWDWHILENKISQSVENFRIFGVRPGEFGNTVEAFFNIVHPDDREFVKESINKALHEKTPYSIDFRILRPDGTVRIVHDQAEVTYDESGQAIRMVGTILDITDRKKIEDELLKTQKLESLGILAGGIAHDFNNLLTAILGNISIAERFADSDSKDNIHKALKEAENASLRAKSLSQQLLTFASGGLPVKKVISPGSFIKETVDFALKGSNVRCKYSIPDDLAPVEVDEGQIGQVIQNLIINAYQAMPEGGVIKVRAENINIDSKKTLPLKLGRYVKISIKDSGIGIPKKHISKIFDPYFTTKQTGSGLGLATTYSIIRNHGGHITVNSKVGAGTTFYVYLPATDKKVDLEIDTGKGSLLGQGRILIMDDEEIIRNFLCDALRHFGYKVESAINGEEAIKLYKRASGLGQPFNAVILDLTVPGGMGGKETVKELLKIDPDANVIVSSGYSKDPIMAEYDKYGFKGVVAKPYNLKELSAVVYKVIKGIPE